MSKTILAFRYFNCHKCQKRFGLMVEIFPKETNQARCECGALAIQEGFQDSKDHNIFQPFWSETMQCRIRDRIDLQKLRTYAKSQGLINVGHVRGIRPDRKAIRWNYEHD